MKLWETKEYRIWAGIKTRCYNSNCDNYKSYGGRGIKVCDRWINNFENFFNDMGKRPSKNHSIDRIDVNGDYSPENCKWSTQKEQSRNMTRNVFLTYKNVTKCRADWEKELGLNVGVLAKREKRGWTLEESIEKTRIPLTCSQAAKSRYLK